MDVIKYIELFEADLQAKIDSLTQSYENNAKAMTKMFNEIKKNNSATLSEQIKAQTIAEEKNNIALAEKTKIEAQLLKANNDLIKAEQNRVKLIEAQTKAEQKAIKTQQDLNSARKQEQKQLSILIKQYEEVATVYGKNSKEARKLLKELTPLKNKVDGISRSFGNFKDNVGNYTSGFKAFGASLLGSLGVVTGITALGAVLSSSFNKIKDFEKGISNLRAITGATGKDLDYLRKSAIELAKSTGNSATDIVEAFKLVGSAKPELLDNVRALKLTTEAVITLSQASGGVLDLSTSTMALTQIMNQFGASADQANRYINVLGAGAKFGSVEINYLQEAITKVGTVANSAGISIEKTTAVMELFGEKGVKAETAGQGFKRILVELQSDTKNYKNGVFDLNTAIENNKNISKDNIALQEKFGKEYFNLAQILFENSARFEDLTTKITGTNVAFEQAAINMDNLSGDLDKFAGSWDALIQSISSGNGVFSKATRGIVQMFTSLIDGFASLNNNKYVQAGLKFYFLRDYKELEKDIETINKEKTVEIFLEKLANLRKRYSEIIAANPNKDKTFLFNELQDKINTELKMIDTAKSNKATFDSETSYLDFISRANERLKMYLSLRDELNKKNQKTQEVESEVISGDSDTKNKINEIKLRDLKDFASQQKEIEWQMHLDTLTINEKEIAENQHKYQKLIDDANVFYNKEKEETTKFYNEQINSEKTTDSQKLILREKLTNDVIELERKQGIEVNNLTKLQGLEHTLILKEQADREEILREEEHDQIIKDKIALQKEINAIEYQINYDRLSQHDKEKADLENKYKGLLEVAVKGSEEEKKIQALYTAEKTELDKKQRLDDINAGIEAGQIAIDAARDVANQIADAKIEALDYEIEESRKRQDEIQSLIDEENKKKEVGAAYSTKILKRQLAAEQAEEKKNLEQRRKIQKAQSIINDAATLSEIVLATAKIFSADSSLPFVGTVAAIAQIATMMASFIATKFAAKKAVSGYADGTEYVELNGNKKGTDTIPAMIDEGERIIDKRTNSKIPRNIKNKDLPTLLNAGISYFNAMQGNKLTSMYVNDFSKLEAVQKDTLDEQKRTNSLLGKFLFISGDGKTIVDINGNIKQYV